jgi:hypothetical protein
MTSTHLIRSELDAGLPEILESPKDAGVLSLIVQRPASGERREVESGVLNVDDGLVGDNWKTRGSAHPEMQINIMNSRAAALVAQDRSRWSLAGDQIYVDLDLSSGNLPPGTRLRMGTAVVEVADIPHTGCRKFVERFGRDAMEFVNSEVGRKLNLRGINAKVVEGGEIKLGDIVTVEWRR